MRCAGLMDQRHPSGVAIASIDVDHFKLFNDNHGHDAGDVVLRSVSEMLQRHADAEGIACRTGGEELMVVWPGIDPPTPPPGPSGSGPTSPASPCATATRSCRG